MTHSRAPGWAVWFVGLPGSGKSSLARAVFDALQERGLDVAILEMDARRKDYFPKPTYSPEERAKAYELFVQEAAGLALQGRGVVMDGTAHLLSIRQTARDLINRFAEVHVQCPLEVAMVRERERPGGLVMAGMYAKALDRQRTGCEYPGLGQVIGVDVPFEEDPRAECVVDSDRLSVQDGRDRVLQFLDEWLRRP